MIILATILNSIILFFGFFGFVGVLVEGYQPGMYPEYIGTLIGVGFNMIVCMINIFVISSFGE